MASPLRRSLRVPLERTSATAAGLSESPRTRRAGSSYGTHAGDVSQDLLRDPPALSSHRPGGRRAGRPGSAGAAAQGRAPGAFVLSQPRAASHGGSGSLGAAPASERGGESAARRGVLLESS